MSINRERNEMLAEIERLRSANDVLAHDLAEERKRLRAATGIIRDAHKLATQAADFLEAK